MAIEIFTKECIPGMKIFEVKGEACVIFTRNLQVNCLIVVKGENIQAI